jgi:hypothetical protein
VTVIAVGERRERGRKGAGFPLMWRTTVVYGRLVVDVDVSTSKKQIENWLVSWMTCWMMLSKLVIGWSMTTRPSFAEDGRLRR